MEHCSNLYPQYFTCNAERCKIGENTTAICHVNKYAVCSGEKNITVTLPCYQCWQLPDSELHCGFPDRCTPSTKPQIGICSVVATSQCLGSRSFSSQLFCQTTTGYSHATAVAMSILFGGFGADRFYLGYTGFGVLKLATLGGFGLWSLIDLICIFTRTLKPIDGSFYV
ncbi:TM2 domain containing protein [Trichomonas vaginalis G3]|uniref:TM2 domain containing protein n=1 Tax=Trichomonas vaginalis (strain ATCC PRA-98 / G3) TaxID=412133 RepID=A2FYD7_TRIV3|nr:amyloid-beta binding [Trichomonas vaginalis G3]EAX90077.1 TM2 domain containing protein [Trichomonas vaginalis G3]KAI5485819.1 amyloid-beta binding [Trichomonas vaginalis G3]|eukprot:XP_001303007.1 TM2 domain containing protein [Trichomonas vaginalis G3]